MTARDAFIDADPTVALQRRLLDDLAAADAAAGIEPQAIVFAAGGKRYGLPSSDVQQLALVPALVPVPGVPGHVRGICAVGGEVYEVLDVARLGGAPTPTAANAPDARLLCLAGDRANLVALLVDRVEPVVALDSLGAARREDQDPAWIHGRTPACVAMIDPGQLTAA